MSPVQDDIGHARAADYLRRAWAQIMRDLPAEVRKVVAGELTLKLVQRTEIAGAWCTYDPATHAIELSSAAARLTYNRLAELIAHEVAHAVVHAGDPALFARDHEDIARSMAASWGFGASKRLIRDDYANSRKDN
jgi:Zn-dependent membrane protease YugP